MTVVVQSTNDETISLPARLLSVLNLREGDEVQAIVDGRILRLAPLDGFLALRGVLPNDEAFDQAMERLDQAWDAWTIPPSA